MKEEEEEEEEEGKGIPPITMADATRSTPTPFCLKKKSVKLGKKNTDSSPCDPTDRIHQEEETKVQTQLNLEKPGKTK